MTQPPLPVLPYAGHVPSAPTDTSVAAAEAITPKVGAWQAKVLLALDKHGPLSDETLERVLHCEATRTSRPRRRELERAGYVRDSGDRCVGIGGVNVILWELTERGQALAQKLAAAEAPVESSERREEPMRRSE